MVKEKFPQDFQVFQVVGREEFPGDLIEVKKVKQDSRLDALLGKFRTVLRSEVSDVLLQPISVDHEIEI